MAEKFTPYGLTALPSAIEDRDPNGVYFIRTETGFKIVCIANDPSRTPVELDYPEVVLPDTSNLVPYSGADKPIDFNTQDFTTGGYTNRLHSYFERINLASDLANAGNFKLLTNVAAAERANASSQTSDIIITLPITTTTLWQAEIDILREGYRTTLNVGGFGTSNSSIFVSGVFGNVDDILEVKFGRIGDSTVLIIKRSNSRIHRLNVNISKFYYHHSNSQNLYNDKDKYKVEYIDEGDLEGFTLDGVVENSDFIRDSYLWNKGDFEQSDIDNWNTAFGWGNHSGLYALVGRSITAGTGLTGGGDLSSNRTIGLSTSTQSDIEKGVTAHDWGNHEGLYQPVGNYLTKYPAPSQDINLALTEGMFYSHTGSTNIPPGMNASFISGMSYLYNSTNGWQLISQRSSSNHLFYRHLQSGTFSDYKRIWDSNNLPQTDVDNWNTAYGWGDHSNAGYATESWVNSQGFSTQTLGNSTSNLIVSNTVQRAALTGDVTAAQNSNATTLKQTIKDDIAKGVTAFDWGNHADAGYVDLISPQHIDGPKTFNNIGLKLQDVYHTPQENGDALIYHLEYIDGRHGLLINAKKDSNLKRMYLDISNLQSAETDLRVQYLEQSKKVEGEKDLEGEAVNYLGWKKVFDITEYEIELTANNTLTITLESGNLPIMAWDDGQAFMQGTHWDIVWEVQPMGTLFYRKFSLKGTYGKNVLNTTEIRRTATGEWQLRLAVDINLTIPEGAKLVIW